MKISKILALVFTLSLCIGLLTACNDTPESTETTIGEGSVLSTETTEHRDDNLDGICDSCEAILGDLICIEHQDDNEDGVCDICETFFAQSCITHEDTNGDGYCNICGYEVDFPCTDHLDSDNDSRCDSCDEQLYEDCEHVDSDEDYICDKCLLAL